MRKKSIAVNLLLIFLVVLTMADGVYAINLDAQDQMNQTKEVCVRFFYGLGCPHCAKVEPFVKELAERYPNVKLKTYEVYYNKTNYELFNKLNEKFGVPFDDRGVPTVVVGNDILIGVSEIEANLEGVILNYSAIGAPCVSEAGWMGSSLDLTLPTVITAALVDSINPCAFAVLIFLLLYLTTIGARRRMLTVGLTYISVVFVVYFLSGLGLFTAIQTMNISRLVYNIAAVIAIVAGLINIKDFFWYGKGISLQIPKSKKPLIKSYIQKATIGSAVILGFLVSMVELPCTGGVYLAILSLLATKSTQLVAIPYLLLYNLIFVLPLVVILLVVYKGISPERAEKWRKSKRKWMRLIMGIVMVGLGVVMLTGVV